MPGAWLRQRKVMRLQFAARRPTEVMAVQDLFLVTEFIAEHCELPDESLGIVEVGNGDKHVENGLGTQAGDSGAPHMVHGEDRWPECRSQLRRRLLEEDGPARVVGNNDDLRTLQPECLRTEHGVVGAPPNELRSRRTSTRRAIMMRACGQKTTHTHRRP